MATPAAFGPDDRVEYDPFSWEIDRDPYPVYRWMRDHAPVYYHARQGFYALTRFDDVLAALVDSERFTSTWSTSLEFMDGPKTGTGLMIYMDPPRHNRYRALVSKAFTPRAIAALEPGIERIARGHLARLEGRARFDVVKEFTAKLPMDVISEMLGIPEADREEVQRRSNLMLHREPGDPMPLPEALDAMNALQGYFDALIAERRVRPRDDMLTRLTRVDIAAEDGGTARLGDADIRQFLVLLATAGNETVTKLLATALHELWRHPDERRALVREPGLIPGAVEETLRYDPPSQYQGRVTTCEVELHGRAIPKHARVLHINGATGRDERRFPDPDRFDVRRRIDFHLGFGHGRHFCLGASLARMESRIALREVLARWPEYAVPEGGAERMHSSNVRGLSRLVLEVA